MQASGPWKLTKIHVVSRTQGWALAETVHGRALLRTSDGGRSWRNVSPKLIWPLSLEQVKSNDDWGIGSEGIDACFLNGRTGWVAMKDLRGWVQVERTRDGGRHWAEARFSDRFGISLLMSFQDRRQGCILTESDPACGSTRKALYRTKDGGRTWTAATGAIPDHVDPSGVTFRNGSDGWLTAGYHGTDLMPFYHTNDGGRHWRLQELETPTAPSFRYGAVGPIRFFGHAKKVGVLPVQLRYEGYDVSAFYLTRDGGTTWQRRSAPTLGTYALMTERHWLGLDQAGRQLCVTTNGGRTWHQRRLAHQLGGPYSAVEIDFPDTQIGWALVSGYEYKTSTLLQTQDGGRHWHTLYPLRRHTF